MRKSNTYKDLLELEAKVKIESDCAYKITHSKVEDVFMECQDPCDWESSLNEHYQKLYDKLKGL